MVQERHWTPEETGKGVRATDALGEHARQRRDRDRNERSRDAHMDDRTGREQGNQYILHMYR